MHLNGYLGAFVALTAGNAALGFIINSGKMQGCHYVLAVGTHSSDIMVY